MQRKSERGAILIFVAITIVVLMGFAAFVIDKGVFWMSRAQAQNAADAGALAGAASLVFDDNTWPIPSGGAVEAAATSTVNQNIINGATGVTKVSSPCPPFLLAPNDTNCVQVDVYRDGQFSSGTLPTYFAALFGVDSQGTRATATAQVSQGNSSGCMRPWFIVERTPNPYCVKDCAAPPYPFASYSDIGQTVTFHGSAGPSAYGQLDVGAGGSAINTAIENCVPGLTFTVGQTVGTDPGNKMGPEGHGIDHLLQWDPDAGGVHVEYQPAGCNVSMNCTHANIVGGCSAAGTCACPSTSAQCAYGGTQSPRLVQAALCDGAFADCSGGAMGKGSIVITNILSFYIIGCNGVVGSCDGTMGTLDIDAVLVASAGAQQTGGSVGAGKSFLTVLRLVR